MPPPRLARVVGKHCESGDIVVMDEYLPDDIAAGDLIAVPGTGAYCRSMASQYNHTPRPPVVGRAGRDVRRDVRCCAARRLDDLLGARPIGRSTARRSGRRTSGCRNTGRPRSRTRHDGRTATAPWGARSRVSDSQQVTAGQPLKVALLGCGVVGSSVARLLTEHADDLAARIGRPLELVGIAVRRAGRDRSDLPVDPALFTTDAESLVTRADIVIEVIGGIEPARSPHRVGHEARRLGRLGQQGAARRGGPGAVRRRGRARRRPLLRGRGGGGDPDPAPHP